MADKRKVEVFSAGRPACEEAVQSRSETRVPFLRDISTRHERHRNSQAGKIAGRSGRPRRGDRREARRLLFRGRIDARILKQAGLGKPL